MRTVLFYRDFRRFHGGHLKVWDYFNHVRSSPRFEAKIAFSERTDWGEDNPWRAALDDVVASVDEVEPGIFFVAGRDWRMIDRHRTASEVPIINFIQGLRHADPGSNRYEFLRRRAIRICVSEVVAEAVRETGIVNGPVFTNPNSVDVDSFVPDDVAPRDIDVLVAALKRPQVGAELASRLAQPDRRIELLAEPLPRETYLGCVARAQTTVFLPKDVEGFYLAPLEGMALGSTVICPRHAGDQSIYRGGRNCFHPAYAIDDLAGATEAALALSADEVERMRAAAKQTAEEHSLERERRGFLEILEAVDNLW